MLTESAGEETNRRACALLAAVAGAVAFASPMHAGAAPPSSHTRAASAPWAVPDGVESAPVASSVHIDGVPVTIRTVRSTLPVDVVAARWLDAWASVDARSTDTLAAGWRVLSRRIGADLLTVQLRAAEAAGTEGYVALAVRARTAAVRRSPEFPFRLPAGLRVLRTVEAIDGGRSGLQSVLETPADNASVLASLAAAARASGWLEDRRAEGPRAQARGRVVRDAWFTRGSEELAIFALRDGTRSLVVVHHVAPAARHGRS